MPRPIPLGIALVPVVFLMLALAYNVGWVFGDESTSGSIQIILFLSAFVAAGLAALYGRTFTALFDGVAQNLREAGKALVILLLIGALSGAWLVSGIIPTLIYYGLEVLHPSYFLIATLLFCSVVSLSTGSSWSTSATVGIALMGVGQALGFSPGLVAGAVISGAYFGDKMSPFSDTTNLAPAMAGTDLFTHIRHMVITTVPTYLITLTVFGLWGIIDPPAVIESQNLALSENLHNAVNISPWLLLVPALSLGLILWKVDAIVAIAVGTLGGSVAALIAQPELILHISGEAAWNFSSAYKGIMMVLYGPVNIPSADPILTELLQSNGMEGMMSTIWLIIGAMTFGGVMEAAGFLTRITTALVSMAHTSAGLIGATLATCGLLNVTAADQYLAIVIPGRMFKEAYANRGLAPQNLSRALEDSGTVTSVLVPWNTCGAYQSVTLGVATGDYFAYAIFNWLSPITNFVVALLGYKITKITTSASSASNEA